MTHGGRSLVGRLVLVLSGVVLLGYATWRHASFDVVVGVVAGSVVAFLIYLIGPTRRPGRTSRP